VLSLDATHAPASDAATAGRDLQSSDDFRLRVSAALTLGRTHAPDALAQTADALADAAHVLAGSAGMFGFERLAVVARHFEHALKSGTAEAPALAAAPLAIALGEVIEASLADMRRHAAAPVGA